MSFLNNLNWRYATKEFDTTKPVSKEKLNKILKAIRMAPTSSGLQSFHVYVVEDLAIRKTMKLHSYNQAQVDTATYLLVFCARTDGMARVDQYVNLVSDGDAKKKANLKGMEDMMKGSMSSKDTQDMLCWSARQAYITLGFALAAAAELKIDSCAMEGFVDEEINKILDLPKHMSSLAYLAIGNRKEDPKRPKVRFPNDDLFTYL